MVLAGKSLVTTLLAPTMAFSPTVMPHKNVALHHSGFAHPIGLCLPLVICRCGAWEPVIDKRHIVTDKDIILDGHTLADKGMALDFAILTNFSSLLDLDERTNLRIVSNVTPIEIHKIVNFDALPKLDIRSNVLCHRCFQSVHP